MAEWRVGGKLKRTLYWNNELVGLADTPEIAGEIVETMNRVGALLAAVRQESGGERSLAAGGPKPPPDTSWVQTGSIRATGAPRDAQRRSEATPQNDLLGPSRVDPYDTTHGGITPNG